MRKKKVIILCPHYSAEGGVASYYALLKKHFSSERVSLAFYYTGNGSKKRTLGRKIENNIHDVFKLANALLDYDLVVLNPSLDAKAVIRDGIFHLMAKRFLKKNTLVFFRGWTPDFERLISIYAVRLFRHVYNFDYALVLSKQFKETLIKWGFQYDSIRIETTMYEYQETDYKKDVLKLIYLSRFEKGKGSLEAIRSLEILIGKYPNIKLFMVGDGTLLNVLQKYVLDKGLDKNIEFTGWLSGPDKYHVLAKCGIMLFPTDYGEGLPNCILEAMGYGLTILTRPIAGLNDILVNGVNGFLIKSLEPEEFARRTDFLIENQGVWHQICDLNRQIAEEKYEVKNVIKRMEKLYFECSA
jgi:glycosyltransferase involved in cell wall biosynthesis